MAFIFNVSINEEVHIEEECRASKAAWQFFHPNILYLLSLYMQVT